jgi:hypothetical protein
MTIRPSASVALIDAEVPLASPAGAATVTS